MQYRQGQTETRLESVSELDKLPWPWPDQGFDEVLVGDAVIRGSIDVKTWISECLRILSPGGALKITIPMRPELYALTGPGVGLDLDPNTFCENLQPSRPLADPSSTPPTASLPKFRLLVENDAGQLSAILIAAG
jgi:ubiquinone/menaquinone biosynthesis C-methylase UbiE